jgi:exodeoxyribonuclease-3
MVTIATWNINSVRLRADQVERFLREQAPDVLCLQEIKTQESTFPHAVFERLGYPPRVHGQKGYHGVATVSRLPLREVSGMTGRTMARRAMSAWNCSGRGRG